MTYTYSVPTKRNKMLDALKARTEERAEKRVTYPVRELPNLLTIPTLTWVGTYSYSIPALKTRYALDNVAIRMFGEWQTPTELSRDYLLEKYGGKPRQYHEQYIVNAQSRGWPYLAKPGFHGDCVYIDLKSAYWSIMQVTGWDAEYFPGKWLMRASVMNDFPLPDNKLARNSIVSSAALSTVSMWTGSKLKTKNIGGKLYNPVVSSIVMDILHGIASDMENLGAVYVHTDGYIVPRYMMPTCLRMINDVWGVPARVKAEGLTVVKGIGAYSVGTTTSGLLGKVGESPARYIMPRSKSWLRESFRNMRERTLLYYGPGSDMSDVDFNEWVNWSP